MGANRKEQEGSGAAKIDFTVESILAAHVISNIRRFDFTYVDSISHRTKAMSYRIWLISILHGLWVHVESIPHSTQAM